MSDNRAYSLYQANQDYARAKRAATLRRVWANLTGQHNNLIPFEDLKETLGFMNQHYRGLQPVPMEKIIGSMGRSDDFDRIFLPTQQHTRSKWLSVDSAYLGGITLPPISLYKVGGAYFVVDGHHRVSVARQAGQVFIDAEVIEVQSRVPVTAKLTRDDLDVLATYRAFLDQTKLDILRPDQNVRLTMPGDYARLLNHIQVHKYFVDQEGLQELSCEEAVAHWYDHVYFPVIRTIRQNNLLADFPKSTEADLYLWIIEHAYYLSQELGQRLDPWQVAKDYVARFGQQPRRWMDRAKRRLRYMFIPDELGKGPPPGAWRTERVDPSEAPHLFRDILVAVTGAETGWRALEQAAEIARRENSVLRGLHVMPAGDEKALAYGRSVLEEFTSRCDDLGIPSTTNLVGGDVARQIIDRARWVDMVVINQRQVHGGWSEHPLGTIFQTVAIQTARPVLAVPGNKITSLERILLAYDGSPKAREALFVLRHMLICWQASGVILTVQDSGVDQDILDAAWRYTQAADNLDVTTRYERGAAGSVIPRVMGEEKADMLLMGSYGSPSLVKVFRGSTVDRVLRVAWFPVLICR